MDFNWADEVEKEIGSMADGNVAKPVTTLHSFLNETSTKPSTSRNKRGRVPRSKRKTTVLSLNLDKETTVLFSNLDKKYTISSNLDKTTKVQSLNSGDQKKKLKYGNYAKTELTTQNETEPAPSTSCAEYREVAALNLNAQPSPIIESPCVSPRLDKITKDMIGRPRFRPIVHYMRSQNLNFVYKAVTNMDTNAYNGSSNENTVIYENYNYEDPNNLQYTKNDFVPCPPTYLNDINTTFFGVPENVSLPLDQNTGYQYEFIPDGYQPYYPCGDSIVSMAAPQVYVRTFDGSNQIVQPNRKDFCRLQMPIENMTTAYNSPRSPRKNTRKSRIDKFREGQKLRNRQLEDEEDNYLLENMDLGEPHRGITSPRITGLKKIETGSQAMDWEDYLLIANISRVNYKFKSCTNLSDSKSRDRQAYLLSKTEQAKTNHLQKVAVEGNTVTIPKLHTKSIGTVTQSLITKSRGTQTGILDIKIPFKNIIPTKYKVKKVPSRSSLQFAKSDETSKKSVANAAQEPKAPEKETTPKTNPIKKTVKSNEFIKTPSKARCPKPNKTRKSVKSIESMKLPTNDEFPKPQSIKKVAEPATESPKPTKIITEPPLETPTKPVKPTSQTVKGSKSPQPVNIPQGDDAILMAPRRKDKLPGEPAYVSYAAVVASRHSTSQSVILKCTESLKPKVDVNIRSSNSPSTRKQSTTTRSPLRQSRENSPNNPRRSNNKVVLELTIKQRLMPHSLKNNFQFYMKHGLQFKSLGRQTILMIFCNEQHAKEVLERPCGLGTIVPISQASERSQEIASKYYSGRRYNTNNTSSRYFHSGYRK